LADFSASALRADDLLALTFDFFNLRLDTTGGAQPRLVRITPGAPAFIVVELPAQHIAEQVFPQLDGGLAGLTPPPIASVMAAPTRLAFQLPDDLQAVPFTLRNLLDWVRFTTSVAPNALPDPPPADAGNLAPAEPAATQTAVEVPYRLVLSPDASAGWSHSAAAVTRGDTTELWHTRLGVRQNGQVDESRLPTIRAVWARDPITPAPEAFPTSLTSTQRSAIAHLSSDFSQTVVVLPPESPSPGGEEIPYIPPPLDARYLTLSALGSWTDVRGSWDFPETNTHIFPSFPVTAWRQLISQGRDQYVRVVEKGFLYPLGHRASRVEVTERTLNGDRSDIDYLGRRTYIVVQEPVRDYSQVRAANGKDAQLPLRVVELTTLVTPSLSPPIPTTAFVPRFGGMPFPFHVVAQDWIGQPVDFDMVLAFVPGSDPSGGPTALASAGVDLTVNLRGQAVALAASPPSPGATTLPVQSFLFDKVDVNLNPPFLPYVSSASVRIPAVDHLLGSATAPPAVAVSLVDPAATPGGMFARLQTRLPLKMPAQKAGGIATPNLSIDGISRSLGTVPAGLDDIAKNTFDPSSLFSTLDGTNLLGGISLKDVIAAVADVGQIPTLQQVQRPDALDITFNWQPRVREFGPLKLSTDPGRPTALSILAQTHLPQSSGGAAGEPSLLVDGELKNFALEFLGVVRVDFDALHFRAEKGRKVQVEPRGVRLQFQNELQFLNELASILPRDDLSDRPMLSVTQEGVRAGYSLGLPAAAIGIFSLEQVALAAEIALPFTSRPAALRLGFSDSAHPFLVTVAMIGGGGHFAIEVDTSDVRLIEGAIEVGANLTVNLAIVAANVHVMAGFYFARKTGAGGGAAIDFSAYLRIGGSVELLGLAGISVDIYLAMTYESSMEPHSIGGRASVVVGVHLLMFTKSVRLSTEKHFAIPPRSGPGGMSAASLGDVSFDELVEENDWEAYCRAFA
jgi:hypothetical protein